MYPEFITTAKEEGNKEALRSFEYAIEVEQIHHDLYSRAAKVLEDDKDMPFSAIFVCPVCGNTVIDTVPDKCPICGVPGSKFSEVS